ncbi:MAG TPA: NCS2 family permease [bacterium]|nr:NCS2 family permease [bacterium]
MDKLFALNANQTNIKTEMIAGITTFLATMYIIVVNPGIISETGMPFNGVLTATVLVSYQGILALPDFSLVFSLNLIEALRFALWPVVFAFLFTDMFDSLSTFIGVSEAADLLDEDGEPRHIKESLITDGFATTISGLSGTSSGTAYIESATGIEEGGRSGLTAAVAGALFLPFMFFSPLLSLVPEAATAPALVLVGIFMIRPVQQIHWSRFDDAIPAFLSLVLIPLTYSITQGIIWGFLSWTIIKAVLGKYDQIPIMLWVIDIFAILALIV